jgi:CBS domain-containing protein
MRVHVSSHDVRCAAVGCGVSASALAANAARRRAAERRALRREVSTAMTAEVSTIRPDASLEEAAERLAFAKAGALPVCDSDERLVGLITDRDIVVRAVAQGEQPAAVRVGDCMTLEPATVTPVTTLEEAAQIMGRHAVRRLPVLLDGKVVGMLSEHDLAVRVPRSRVDALAERVAAAPADRPSAAWLFRHAHGPARRRPSAAALDRSRATEVDRAVNALRTVRDDGD